MDAILGLPEEEIVWNYNLTALCCPRNWWHSYQYGFILRYPQNKEDITGVAYEPWHVRYVGQKTAESIYHNGLCLEEYLYTHKNSG